MQRMENWERDDKNMQFAVDTPDMHRWFPSPHKWHYAISIIVHFVHWRFSSPSDEYREMRKHGKRIQRDGAFAKEIVRN